MRRMIHIFEYTIIEWMLFFYIYCFLGWCVESAIVSYRQRRWINRGYLTIPMLPLYGTGAITVLLISLPVRNSVILVYFFGMIAATILEYVTGWVMESILKVKYWDYTGKFGNIKGRICLESSLFWGVLSIFMTYVLHKPIARFVTALPTFLLNESVLVITVIFTVDFILSTKKALDFKHMLEYMAKTRERIEELYDELEEKGKEIGERGRELREELRESIRESKESIRESREFIRESIETRIEESIENTRLKTDATTEEIMKKIAFLKKEREEKMEMFLKFRGILKANPTATSKHFYKTFNEIKEKMKQK